MAAFEEVWQPDVAGFASSAQANKQRRVRVPDLPDNEGCVVERVGNFSEIYALGSTEKLQSAFCGLENSWLASNLRCKSD
ncbi:hypothetical protein EBR21_18155 [bacterium]|nr:hypothetical protein [bacterium]